MKIDPSVKYQTILGFGGALTGSTVHLLNLMPPKLKQKVLETYFSKETGLAFTFLRTSIGGCDFDLKPWAYNELPEHDGALRNFTNLDDRDLLKVSITCLPMCESTAPDRLSFADINNKTDKGNLKDR